MPRSAVAAADAIVGMAHNVGFVIVGMRLSCGCAWRIAGGKVEGIYGRVRFDGKPENFGRHAS